MKLHCIYLALWIACPLASCETSDNVRQSAVSDSHGVTRQLRGTFALRSSPQDFNKALASLCAIYYNFTDYNENSYFIDIYSFPFDISQVDSNHVFTAQE